VMVSNLSAFAVSPVHHVCGQGGSIVDQQRTWQLIVSSGRIREKVVKDMDMCETIQGFRSCASSSQNI